MTLVKTASPHMANNGRIVINTDEEMRHHDHMSHPQQSHTYANTTHMVANDVAEDSEEEATEEEAMEFGPNDLVIALMGGTGAGKSTFISLLADQPVRVGHNLNSCTTDIGIYSFQYDGDRMVYLIDTPGFDDTNRSDADILKDIAVFLGAIYARKVSLAGIIYLHRITDTRMSGSSVKNLNVLKKICGQDGFQNVILATTMWKSLEAVEGGLKLGFKREDELRLPQFWGEMIQHGSQVLRHDGSPESARNLVSSLVQLDKGATFRLQVQMVDEKKNLQETDAGQYVQGDLLQVQKKLELELAETRTNMEEALAERDAELLDGLRQEKKDAEAKIAQRKAENAQLNISLEQLASQKGVQYRSLLAKSEDGSEPFNGVSSGPKLQELEFELHSVKAQLEEAQTSHYQEMMRQRLLSDYQAVKDIEHARSQGRERELALIRKQTALEKQHERCVRRHKKQQADPLSFLKHLFGFSYDEEQEIQRPRHKRHRRERGDREYFY